jgi:hypothetical protein
MGVDDLLLGLTHHWAQDTSVFPTEDDRLDLPTIMLFQAYTACRPAELVDATKSRGSRDPLVDDSINVSSYVQATSHLNTPLAEIMHTSKMSIKQKGLKSRYKHDSDSESGAGVALFGNEGYDSDATSNTGYSVDSDESQDDKVGRTDIFRAGP